MNSNLKYTTETRSHREKNGERTLCPLCLCASVVFIVFSGFTLFAADISAPKMEIIDSPQGRMTVFPQGITITDKDMTITGKSAIFYEKENRAKIYDSLLIISPQFTITADTADYSFAEKKTNLKGHVKVESETLQIKTPFLTFEQGRNLAKARNGVIIKEKQQNLTIFSKTGEYDFNEALGIVDSFPTLQIERSDTTIVNSRKMILKNRQFQFVAIDSVSAKTGKTILMCDTLLFFIKEDSGLAFGNPKVLDKQNQISGKTIRFYFSQEDSIKKTQEKSALKTVKIIDAASATYITDDGGKLQVQGNIISINYKHGDIDNIQVFGDSLNFVFGQFTPKQKL